MEGRIFARGWMTPRQQREIASLGGKSLLKDAAMYREKGEKQLAAILQAIRACAPGMEPTMPVMHKHHICDDDKRKKGNAVAGREAADMPAREVGEGGGAEGGEARAAHDGADAETG